MKTIAPLKLLLMLLVLGATQAGAGNGPDEVLPASSPYGEATVRKNIPYSEHPADRQNFDLYLPKNKTDQPFPLLIWIHGGAWMSGIKDWDDVKFLVRHGYAIASIDYRFSSEAPFPAQIQDCNAAMDFILAHATEYGVSSNRFIVGGGSAGGHLALLLGMARQERSFGANPSLKPLAILDFYGPTDFNKMADDLSAIHATNGLALFRDVVPKLLGSPRDSFFDKAAIASPMSYLSAGNPPVLIAHGGRDDLVPILQGERLHRALDKAGVKNQLVKIEKSGHAGPLFSSREMEDMTVAFLNGILTNAVSPAAEK